MKYDRLTANPPPEYDVTGTKYGDECNRYNEPDDDEPRGYKPKPCDGVMEQDGEDVAICDTCGSVA